MQEDSILKSTFNDMDSSKNGKISVELIEATLKNLEIEQSIREQRMPISLIRRVSEEEELIIEPPKTECQESRSSSSS